MQADKMSIHSTFTRAELERLYGDHFTDGNKVRLLWKGEDLFQTIFDVIASARKLICLEFYIFRNDETGIELANLLKKKSKEGINVYIIYDHFGSFGTSMRFWKDLRSANIHVKASYPFKWTAPLRYVHRDHKKLIIIDGEKAFTGGLNIANEYSGYYSKKIKRKRKWRDTGIMLEGPIALRLLYEFNKSWAFWKGKQSEPSIAIQPFKQKESFTTAGDLPVLPIFASSSKGRRKLRRLLYYSINHARHSIYLTTAYFTPSQRMIAALAEAVKRGVDVKLLLPLESDVPAAQYAGQASYTKLLKAGVQIYNYIGEILHAKTAVFDGCWSIIGSANLDSQSLRWNDEGNVGILDRTFGQEMTDVFQEDLGNSVKIELNAWLNRKLCSKIKEKFFALFRRRL